MNAPPANKKAKMDNHDNDGGAAAAVIAATIIKATTTTTKSSSKPATTTQQQKPLPKVLRLSSLPLEFHRLILGFVDANTLWRSCAAVCQDWRNILLVENNTDKKKNFWTKNPHLTQHASRLIQETMDYIQEENFAEMFRRYLFWDFDPATGLVSGYRVGHLPASTCTINGQTSVRDFTKAGVVVQTMLDALEAGDAHKTLSYLLGAHDKMPMGPWIVKYQQEYINLSEQEWKEQRSDWVAKMEDSVDIEREFDELIQYEPITGAPTMVATGLSEILRRTLALEDVSETCWKEERYQQFWDYGVWKGIPQEDYMVAGRVESVPLGYSYQPPPGILDGGYRVRGPSVSRVPSVEQVRAIVKARQALESTTVAVSGYGQDDSNTSTPFILRLEMTDSNSVAIYFWCRRIGDYLAGLIFMVERDS